MWEPDGIVTESYNLKGGFTQNGSRIAPRIVEFTRFGLFRGDFGTSLRVAPGVNTLSLFGIDLPSFLLHTLGPTLTLMLLATLQRLDARPLRTGSFAQARELHGIRPLYVLG